MQIYNCLYQISIAVLSAISLSSCVAQNPSLGPNVAEQNLIADPAHIAYSLRVTTIRIQTLGNGTIVKNISEERRLHAADGRERDEYYSNWKGENRLGMVNIYDPIAGLSINLHTQMKSATIFHYVRPDPRTPEEIKAASESVRKLMQNGLLDEAIRLGWTEEKLGSETIEGFRAEHTRYTYLIPINSMGNDREIRDVVETWVSPELRLELKRTEDDPRTAKVTMVVTDLKVGDAPIDPKIFEIPSDYRVDDTAKRVQTTSKQ